MMRYLLFDSGCTACTRVALQVEQIANGWIRVRSLSDPAMQTLLTRGSPKWKWEPMLIEVDEQNVKVFTGLRMGIRIVAALGPRRFWQIARHMREVEHTQRSSRLFTSERRTFLRRLSVAMGGGLLAAFGLPTQSLASTHIGSFRWERVSSTEAKAIVDATRVSPQYQSFVSQLSHPLAVGTGAVVVGHGALAIVAVPVTIGNSFNGGVFAALVDRTDQTIQQTFACAIESHDNRHHAHVKLNDQVILDATFDENGTVVTGWIHRSKGEQQSIAGQNNVLKGLYAWEDLRKSFAQQGSSIGIQQSSFECLNACLSNAGLPLYLLALIGTVCAVACAITAGFGCFACLSALLGGLLGVGLRCLVNCGYAVP